jgi:hypothetical protein
MRIIAGGVALRFRRARKDALWGSLGALAWTHVGYPVTAAAGARAVPAVRKQDIEPTVTFIVAAHDEETVIEQRLANLLELDYPPDKLDIVVVPTRRPTAPTARRVGRRKEPR